MKIKVIIPRDLLLDPKKLTRGLENGLTASAKAARIDFDVTTQTWRNRPTFTIEEQPGQRTISTDDDVYRYVNDGTPAHPIAPKNGKALAFRWGGKGSYSPKTAPRVIGSSGGGASGGIVKLKSVQHPGTEARNFDEVIAEKWEEKLPVTVQRAIDAEVD